MDNILIKIISDNNFLTILSGVIVFIISQLIFEFIIKPREEFNKLKGEIFCCLTMYANIIANPLRYSSIKDVSENKEYLDASKNIRFIASRFAGVLESHKFVCRKKKYYSVTSNLIKLSNNLWIDKRYKKDIYTENIKFENEIKEKFKIK